MVINSDNSHKFSWIKRMEKVEERILTTPYVNDKEFGAHVERVNRVMRIDLIRRFKMVGIDLTPEQWVVLSKASEKEEMSQSEIANASFKDAPTVSRIIDILCDKGYLIRSGVNGDKRKLQISLTPIGSQVVQKAIPSVLLARRQGWEGLSANDYANFIRIMDVMMDNFQNAIHVNSK